MRAGRTTGAAFWTGRFASALGTALTSLTIPFYLTVYLRLDPIAISVVLAGPLVATLLSPLYAGVLADLFDRKRVSIVSELVRTALLVVFALAAAMTVDSVLLLTLINALVAVAKSIFSASFNAGLPDILGEDRLELGNARLQTYSTVAETGGAALGGAALSFLGPFAAFMLNAGAYLFSALGLIGTPWPGSTAVQTPRKEPYFHRVAAGFVAVRQRPLLAALMGTSAVANLVIHLTAVALLWLLVRDLGYPFFAYSIVLGVGSAGAVVGALLASRLETFEWLSTMRVQAGSLVVYGVLLAAYAALSSFSVVSVVVACLIDFGIGFAISAYVIKNITQQQTAVSRNVRGSVSSVRSFSNALAGLIGTSAAGIVIELFGARPVVFACGIALALTAVGYVYFVGRAKSALVDETATQA